ncbi:MAG: sugar phosphate isomerase/epimerase [Candidatus Bathyarchaeota archaeon]|nr:sugar phosphate isomerase/epimerase [Candidatus Bathyarchaeota archaeon]
MFKISVITDEVSQDLESAARFANRFNLDGVEIRSVWGRNPQDLLGRAVEIKRILSKHNLKVCAIASPFLKADIDSEKEYREHLEILNRCIGLAEALDTNLIRGFTFWRQNRLEDSLEAIVEKYQKPLEILEAADVVLGIENEPSTFAGNGRELAIFLASLRSDNVRGIWDPGNDIWDSSGETPYPDGYGHVKEWVVHVHIKDGVRSGEDGKPESVPFGEGEVDYYNQLRVLKEDGYTGYLSLETHWRPKKRLSEQIITRPGGEEFSRFGGEASEICMRSLLEMLSRI